jgi:hypothetical protein
MLFAGDRREGAGLSAWASLGDTGRQGSIAITKYYRRRMWSWTALSFNSNIATGYSGRTLGTSYVCNNNQWALYNNSSYFKFSCICYGDLMYGTYVVPYYLYPHDTTPSTLGMLAYLISITFA